MSALGGGGVCSQGGSAPGGVSAHKGVSGPGGGGISQHALRQTTPPVDRHMPVKTLPWPNFVAAGNYQRSSDLPIS